MTPLQLSPPMKANTHIHAPSLHVAQSELRTQPLRPNPAPSWPRHLAGPCRFCQLIIISNIISIILTYIAQLLHWVILVLVILILVVFRVLFKRDIITIIVIWWSHLHQLLIVWSWEIMDFFRISCLPRWEKKIRSRTIEIDYYYFFFFLIYSISAIRSLDHHHI